MIVLPENQSSEVITIKNRNFGAKLENNHSCTTQIHAAKDMDRKRIPIKFFNKIINSPNFIHLQLSCDNLF